MEISSIYLLVVCWFKIRWMFFFLWYLLDGIFFWLFEELFPDVWLALYDCNYLRFLFSSLHVSYWPTAHARKMIQLLYSMPSPMISARSPCLFILHKWSSQQFQSMLRSIILWMIQIWYCPVLPLKYYPNRSIKMFSNSKYKEDRISDF